MHPEDRPAFDVAWRYADLIGRDGEIVQQEYRLVGVDGVSRWVRDRAAITVLDASRVLLTGAVRDISDQRRAEDERADAVRRLEWLSSVDALTELFNRRHFSEVLRARLAGSATRAAIALVDVDHFKRINDSYGHLTGDVVLREIARRLKDATRPCDVTSRWGGEEFCVLLDEIDDEAELQRLVERLRLAVSATPIAVDAENSVLVTISIGAVRPSPECSTSEQLLASADAALYAAKRGGRNQARIARGAPALVPIATADGLEGVVQALAAAASIRGGTAPLHCAQVAALSTAVAVQLGLPPATVELARLGGWLHDCGKVTVPADILVAERPARRAGACPHPPSRDRRRGARQRRAGPRGRGAGRAQPSRALRRRGLPRWPGRRGDPGRRAHRRRRRRVRRDDREPALRGAARPQRGRRRAASAARAASSTRTSSARSSRCSSTSAAATRRAGLLGALILRGWVTSTTASSRPPGASASASAASTSPRPIARCS